jgi:hypothetical protein
MCVQVGQRHAQQHSDGRTCINHSDTRCADNACCCGGCGDSERNDGNSIDDDIRRHCTCSSSAWCQVSRARDHGVRRRSRWRPRVQVRACDASVSCVRCHHCERALQCRRRVCRAGQVDAQHLEGLASVNATSCVLCDACALCLTVCASHRGKVGRFLARCVQVISEGDGAPATAAPAASASVAVVAAAAVVATPAVTTPVASAAKVAASTPTTASAAPPPPAAVTSALAAAAAATTAAAAAKSAPAVTPTPAAAVSLSLPAGAQSATSPPAASVPAPPALSKTLRCHVMTTTDVALPAAVPLRTMTLAALRALIQVGVASVGVHHIVRDLIHLTHRSLSIASSSRCT